MRQLSRAEAVVTQRQLAYTGENSNAAVGGGSLPRRTLETARQRIYSRAWIVDRLVPNPAGVGLPIVTFAVTRPFSEGHTLLRRTWMEQPSAALLWASPNLLFGVFLSSDSAGAADLSGRLVPTDSVDTGIAIDVDSTQPLIPAYFDFEGSWASFAQLAGTLRYPQSLPRAAWGEGAARAHPGERRYLGLIEAISPAVLSDLSASSPLRRLRSPLERARNARYLDLGLLEARAFLDPTAVVRWVTGFPRRIAFVYGDLLPGARPSDLFRGLVTRAGVAPFLFATDLKKVLIGALSADPAGAESPRARPADSVLGVLREHLRGIVVLREELESLACLLQHRYEHPLASAKDRTLEE
jgi:hypothetical protein